VGETTDLSDEDNEHGKTAEEHPERAMDGIKQASSKKSGHGDPDKKR
jgi:hypothetical protein